MSDQLLIDLDKFRSSGARVFAGRDRGREVRRVADLDSIDAGAATATVHVPPDTLSVNSSFFLGLFGPSVRRLREEGFRAKYHFTGKRIERTISACIEEALNTASPF
jgi:hypothetical protein